MYGYIYKTTNLFNGKIYVGQHRAANFDCNYFGSGVKFSNIFNKYGPDMFQCELLEECFSEKELNEREIYWINKLNATNPSVGYNLMSGGYKVRGAIHSIESRKKISIAKTGKHPNRNYHDISDTTKAKISKTLKEYYTTHKNPRCGVKLSNETKEKLRQANLGKKYPQEVRDKHKLTAWNKGIPMTEEAKQHLREINTGKIIKRRTVGQYSMTNELVRTYISCTDAARKTGFSRANITKCCLGKKQKFMGYMWKYLD